MAQASAVRNFVAKLSLPSSTTSYRDTRSTALCGRSRVSWRRTSQPRVAREAHLRRPRVRVGDGAHLVDDARVVVARDEAGGEPLDLRGPALPARDRRARVRLDRDDPRRAARLPRELVSEVSPDAA